MTIGQTHRGSALLVVLGMVAFMVVSAVAFSAYMRYSRMPSSFLRQTDSSRLLVKAALANAIDEIDAAVGNNPHPNVGRAKYAYPRDGSGGDENTTNRNVWLGRVYMGSDGNGGVDPVMTSESQTVSPLTMEGLAYIPPPLVNEVRYYSRRSRAAQWHRMNFDAGRFAFCAVDVSDYFDVNALGADAPRSSEPESKVSMAYLFEGVDDAGNHTSTSGGPLGSASTWDSFMSAFVGKTKVPLVSLADWNLAMNNGGPFKTPFCNYVENNPGNFYNLSDGSGAEAEKIRMMTFVTDSYFPPAAVTAASEDDRVYDLFDASDTYQPWAPEGVLDSMTPSSIEPVFGGMNGMTDGIGKRLSAVMPFPVLAALYDYLDKDRVPISLALPTVERVPMVCGLEVAMVGSKLKVTKKSFKDDDCTFTYSTGTPATSPTRTVVGPVQYDLNGDVLLGGGIAAGTLLVYPFRHKDAVKNSGCALDGCIRLFFSSADVGLRLNDESGDSVAALRELNEKNFTDAFLEDGVVNLPLKSKALNEFGTEMQEEKDAVLTPQNIKVEDAAVSTVVGKLNDTPLFKVYVQFQQSATLAADGETYDWSNPTPAYSTIDVYSEGVTVLSDSEHKPAIFDILDENGAKLPDDAKLKLVTGKSAELRLNVAAAMRVTMQNEDTGNAVKVVDMVPANGYCDQTFNKVANWSDMCKMAMKEASGANTPLLRFDADSRIALTKEGLAKAVSGQDAMVNPRRIMIQDPRYNYAPESWFSYSGGISEENWLNECGANQGDGDIFLQTSDQCRLQSVYEFANLPRIGGTDGLRSKGDNSYRGSLAHPNDFAEKTFVSDKSKAQNASYMWKTYDPFSRYQEGGDGFEDLNLASGKDGYRICPYSDNTNVLMAAFANTPHDWRCAYFDNKDIKNEDMSAATYNKDYAWNEYSNGAKLKWDDLKAVAGKFMSRIRRDELVQGDDVLDPPWRDALYESFNGSRDTDRTEFDLCGVGIDESCKVFNTDRKYLYGFWNDSFSARQQLFLVFVRAEPAMMGGGLIRQTPPQLGARAVALVWRDPAATRKDAGSSQPRPHRTRILFYRQFD